MEGSSPFTSHQSHDPAVPAHEAEKGVKEALPKQSEERGEPETKETSLIGSNWPSLSLPSESGSPIQPEQGSKPASPTSPPWKIRQRDPEEYEQDRVGKYADYFKDNELLPIPEILQKLEPDGDRPKNKAAGWAQKGGV